jgi:hypothetical protein
MASLRRAVALADGWAPFALEVSDYARMLDRVEVPAQFAVVLPVEHLADPLDEPARLRDALLTLREAGATHANVRIRSSSPEHYVDQLEALRSLAVAIGVEFEPDAGE